MQIDAGLDPCAGCPAACVARRCVAVTQIAAAAREACARLETGSVMCWGGNETGVLGTGSVDALPHPVPTTVAGLRDVTEIALSETHACARHSTALVSCWGGNASGELGHDGAPSSPVLVEGLSGVTHVGVGPGYSCAAAAGGVATCWGIDDHGQLGDGGEVGRSTRPVKLAVAGVISGFALAKTHGCAVTVSGEVWCWGSNTLGEIGTGTPSKTVMKPHKVTTLAWVTGAAANANRTCATRLSGVVACWGGAETAATPSDTQNAIEVGEVVLGDSIACVRKMAGTVFCGTIFFNVVGGPVFGGGPKLQKAAEIATGAKHGCGLLLDGTIQCWGDNALGQLGDTTTNSRGESGRVVW